MNAPFPRGRKAQSIEREKLEKFIAKLGVWKDGFRADEEDARRKLDFAKTLRVTTASATRREQARSDMRIAESCADSLASAMRNLSDFIHVAAPR